MNFVKTVITASILGLASSANAAVDLSSWTQHTTGGNHDTPNWIVSGNTAKQTTNTHPAFLVSDQSYINNTFSGTINSGNDDDKMGIVFGWQNSEDFYLIDWKRGNQNHGGLGGQAKAGFYLSHISGSTIENDYWMHVNNVNLVDSDLRNLMGTTEYDYSLNYSDTGFTFTVNNEVIFSETGSFSAGKVGLYNAYQPNAFYSVSAVPEPSTYALMLGGLGLVGLMATRRKKA